MSAWEHFSAEDLARLQVFDARIPRNRDQHLRDLERLQPLDGRRAGNRSPLLRDEVGRQDPQEEEDDFSDEELEIDCLPDLDDVDANGKPLVIPSPPLVMECPNYPINDPESAMRRYFQDKCGSDGSTSHRLLETVVGRLMEIPELMNKTRTEAELHSYLFGWESFEWRRHVFRPEENEQYSKQLAASTIDVLNIGRSEEVVNEPI